MENEMNDFLNNDFTKGFGQLVTMQQEFVKQATAANKKAAVQVLENTKTAAEAFVKTVEDQIRRLNNI